MSAPELDVTAAADHAVRSIAALVPGWDGPIPTGDNLHDVCDPNAYVADALKSVLGMDLADDPEFVTVNATLDQVIADPRVDTDAPSDLIDAFHRAAWGR